jgi:glycosyltransferase involved in cell wall biosynthesis
VEIVSLNPRKHRAAEAVAPVQTQTIDIDTSRVIGPLLRALTGKRPFIVERFVSREFKEALQAALRRFKPDVVQIESPFLLPYAVDVRKNSEARVALRSLNVEFRIWEGLARNEPNRLRRFALQRVASSLRAYEVRQLDTPDAIVPISIADANDFRALGCTRPMHVVPCGITLTELGDVAPALGTVGFIGSLDFRPNQEAAEWILDELWPRVIERAPEAKLSIAGSTPPDWLRTKAHGKNVAFLGAVDDAQTFMQGMAVIIAPLFAGGGMRIKVLEAMALAKPVVATSLGAGGIEVENERDILIAGDATSFAENVVRLLHESETAARIGNAARATVAKGYDNDSLARGLLEFYRGL